MVDEVYGNLYFFGSISNIADIHMYETVDNVDVEIFLIGNMAILGEENPVAFLESNVSLEFDDFFGGGRAGVIFVFEQNSGFVAMHAIDAVVATGGFATAVDDFVAGKNGLEDGVEFGFGDVAFERGIILVFVEEFM